MIAVVGALALTACSGDDPQGTPSKELLDVNPDKVIDANSITDTIAVKANCRWTVDLVKGWDDLVLSTHEGSGNGAIRLDMQKNAQTTTREGVLRVVSNTGVIIKTVNVKQRGIDPYIEVSKTAIEETFEGGEQIVTIRSNAEWEIFSDGMPGFHCSTTEGNGNGSVSFTTDPNPYEEERTSVFTIQSKNDGVSRLASATVVITQKPRTIEISVQPQDVISVVADGGTHVIAVTCTDNWVVTGGADGFTCDVQGGEKNGQVRITVAENMYETERTATFVFTTVGTSADKSASVTLRQDGKQVTLATSVGSLMAQAIGGSYQIPVLCNAAWWATSSASWLNVETAQGEGDGAVSLNCEQNTQTTTRSAVVTIMAGSHQQYVTTVTVEQRPGAAPSVQQTVVSEVSKYSAVVSFGYQSSTSVVSEYGVCFATHENPTVNDGKVARSGNDTGNDVTFTLSNLESGTMYFVRPFARNATGITYGEQVSFTTAGKMPGDDDNPDPQY